MSDMSNLTRLRRLRIVLWLCIILDAIILGRLGVSLPYGDPRGFWAWLSNVHLVPISSANGDVVLAFRPDYAATAMVASVILGAFALTFFVARVYLRRRGGS